MLLVVDNGSIYTKNLIQLLSQKNISYAIKTPDTLDLTSLNFFNSIILTGRRKNEKKINQINSKIVKYCVDNSVKLLGICYGAEILALTLGGTIRKTSSLQKGKELVEIQSPNSLTEDRLIVFQSHRFEISKLPKMLVALAKSNNCQYEIIQYHDLPIFGTQFHPEMTSDGHKLIEKFCNL